MKRMLFSLLVIGFSASTVLAADEISRTPTTQIVTNADTLPPEWKSILSDPVALRRNDDVWGESSEVHLISLPSRTERGTSMAEWNGILVDPVAERKDAMVLARAENALSQEWKNILSDPVSQRGPDDVWGETSDVHLISLPSKDERAALFAQWESIFVDSAADRKSVKLLSARTK